MTDQYITPEAASAIEFKLEVIRSAYHATIDVFHRKRGDREWTPSGRLTNLSNEDADHFIFRMQTGSVFVEEREANVWKTPSVNGLNMGGLGERGSGLFGAKDYDRY